jgi:hypothetical protein
MPEVRSNRAKPTDEGIHDSGQQQCDRHSDHDHCDLVCSLPGHVNETGYGEKPPRNCAGSNRPFRDLSAIGFSGFWSASRSRPHGSNAIPASSASQRPSQ